MANLGRVLSFLCVNRKHVKREKKCVNYVRNYCKFELVELQHILETGKYSI